MLELLNIVSMIRLFKIIIGTKPWLVELKILYPVHQRLLKCVNVRWCYCDDINQAVSMEIIIIVITEINKIAKLSSH